MLAEYDDAAWHATTAVVALRPEAGTVRRTIARKTDAGWIVEFGRLNDTRDAFLVAYEATQGSDPKKFAVQTYDPPKRDTGYFLVAAKAIEASLQNFQGERRPYGAYVLPADSGQLYVYVVPAPTQADVYPIGGDTRYLVSADGSTVIETRKLHATLFEIKNSALPGGKEAAEFRTDILNDAPWIRTSSAFFAGSLRSRNSSGPKAECSRSIRTER
jgi:hypothetical protein